MSFSSNVKSELLHCFVKDTHCIAAEVSAIINLCGQITEKENKICIKIQTENTSVARKCFTLITKNFNLDSRVVIKCGRKNRKINSFAVSVGEKSSGVDMERFLEKCCFYRGNDGKYNLNHIDEKLFYDSCCRKAYIRGAFLSAGSVNDPGKTYHMEFVVSDKDYCTELMNVINSFGIEAKSIIRKEHYVIYIKDGEQIADMLNIMGAHVSLMEFENIRILKDMRNNVNRKVNCETANINKTISAAVKQIEEIEFIRDNYGLSYLPPALYATAQARLDYPEASLKELGEKMSPPVGKSGINHRLQKISLIAENLMKGMG